MKKNKIFICGMSSEFFYLKLTQNREGFEIISNQKKFAYQINNY